MSRANYTAQQFIKAIPGTGGIITTIAARVGCAWHTAKRFINDYPTVAEAYQDECERVLDRAEVVVIDSFANPEEDPDIHTAKWYLKMKGGKRGYVQKQAQDVTGQVTIKYAGNVNPEDL